MKKTLMIFIMLLFSLTSFSVYAQKVCVVAIDPTKMDWSSIDDCKKNDILDVTVFKPYNLSGGLPNFVTRLVANFCDYNKSIIVDKSNNYDFEAYTTSFTCVKRN